MASRPRRPRVRRSSPTPPQALTRQVNLTPAEELAQSEQLLSRMDSSRSGVRRQLETARAQRDVVKTLCLNDKLNQLDVAIRSARERRQSLEAAASRADADLATHEFTILSVLRQRADQLTAEANQCIGQEAGFIGDSAVTATVEPASRRIRSAGPAWARHRRPPAASRAAPASAAPMYVDVPRAARTPRPSLKLTE